MRVVLSCCCLLGSYNATSLVEQEAKKDESEFDTLQFTPGSEFMQKLKDALVYLSVQRLAKQKPQLQFHISGSDRQGEGELKIFEHIAATPKSDRCLVVGKYVAADAVARR